MIGGFSKVAQDVPPYIMVDGNLARIAGLNKIGMVREGVEEDTRKVMKRAYKLLYYSGLSIEQALEAMERELPKSEELESFITFLRNSKSGICQKVLKQKR